MVVVVVVAEEDVVDLKVFERIKNYMKLILYKRPFRNY